MTFATFCLVVQDSIAVDLSGFNPQTRLTEAMDSLTLFEVVATIEESTNAQFPDDLLAVIQTVGELAAWYESRLS